MPRPCKEDVFGKACFGKPPMRCEDCIYWFSDNDYHEQDGHFEGELGYA